MHRVLCLASGVLTCCATIYCIRCRFAAVLRTADRYKTCTYSLPAWHHLVFLFLFCLEAAIKIAGLGFSGGRYAWWTHDFFNKLDILALAAYFYETSIAMAGGTSNFSLRGLRMMRLLKPVGQLGVFSDLQTIFHAFGMALAPMATVLLFIWFILILFGICGMAVYGKASFRRRCVWADTLEIKSPEMFCSREEYYNEYPGCVALLGEPSHCAVNPLPPVERKGSPVDENNMPLALQSNCGPLQLCLDVGNPNEGFGSFDHLPAAMLLLFQVMSGDSDVNILWYAIESEPSLRMLTSMYFLSFALLVIHVLINGESSLPLHLPRPLPNSLRRLLPLVPCPAPLLHQEGGTEQATRGRGCGVFGIFDSEKFVSSTTPSPQSSSLCSQTSLPTRGLCTRR